MNTEEKLDFLHNEIEELHAMQVGLSAVIASLIATHPDRPAFFRQLQAHRAVMATGENQALATPEQQQLALKMVDWLSLDTPPKI